MKDTINVKLSQYLVNEITQEQLNKWAIDMLHQMLKGDVFQLSILEVWGIITELAGAGDLEKELCDNLVQQFSDILSGKIQAAFSVAVQIPNRLVMKDLVHVKDILQKYMQKKTLSKIEIQKLKLVVKEKVCPVNTLSQMLKEQIIGLLKLGYDFDLEDSDMIFDLKSTLFIHYDIERALESELLSKIIQLLDCYNGEKCFFVNIRYEKGEGIYLFLRKIAEYGERYGVEYVIDTEPLGVHN